MRIVNARVIDISDGSASEPGDLWISRGRLARCPSLSDDPVLDLEGRFVIPGLWDAHVHMTQWAMARRRTDVSSVGSRTELVEVLGSELVTRPEWAHDPVVAVGLRSASWPEVLDGAQMDALAPDVPLVVISSDLHATWANRAALDRFGLSHLASGRLVEQDAFDVQLALNSHTSASDADHDEWVAEAAREAAGRGLVGVVDMERNDNLSEWGRRMDAGFDTLRVRASVWPERLADRVRDGVQTGAVLHASGLLVQGPLKVIVDGSILAGTAWCREPYGDPPTTGVCSVGVEELTDLLHTAARAGLDAAVHAIGDTAVDAALDAFAESGARGTIEHAHLATDDQAARMGSLGVHASVQPQHLPDDRDPCERLWPGRAALPFRTLSAAGVSLSLGSDAPVVPLSPWHAIEYAVTRTGDARQAWHPEECLTLSEAIKASTGGVCRLVPGAPADLAALDVNPFELDADRLHTVTAAVTLVAGSVSNDQR